MFGVMKLNPLIFLGWWGCLEVEEVCSPVGVIEWLQAAAEKVGTMCLFTKRWLFRLAGEHIWLCKSGWVKVMLPFDVYFEDALWKAAGEAVWSLDLMQLPD